MAKAPRTITRRMALSLGAGLAVLACSDDEPCIVPDEWAAGGTAAMTRKDCYPDPFAVAATTCTLLCETTAGPCTADTLERQDISEGLAGLPVRLALEILDADTCEPIEGVVVEIWHTQRTGAYSGVTPNGMICNGGDTEAESQLYFRGTQTTDARGRVDFDTCYPGWYPGRAIHIHVRVGSVIGQLFFTDELTEEIFANHPDYVEFGPPDTTNGTDHVLANEADISPCLLETERMADGAMLAWKSIAIA